MNDSATKTMTVRLERTLPGPIERVWAYLVESEKRRTWFASGEIEPRVGGRADLFFKHDQISDEPAPEPYREMMENGVASPETVTAWDPPHRLGYTFGEGEVTFELIQQGDEVKLVLTQVRATEGERGGWTAHLYALEERLHGRKPNRFWTTVMEQPAHGT